MTGAPRPRIAIVTSFPASAERPAGGVESVSVTLVEHLAKDTSIEWHVVTLADVAEVERTTWKGATVHRVPRPRGSMLAVAVGSGRRQVHRYLTNLRPDLIHSHDTYGMMVRGLALDAPRVFTVHGFIHKDTLVSGQNLAWLRSRLWKPFETAGWADQDYIVSISPYVREALAGHTAASIHDIDNPVREDFFAIERQEKAGRIFCAAEISPRKNTLVLVEAIGKLRDQGVGAQLHLAGKVTHERYGALVDELVLKRSLQDRVFRLGSIPYERVREELRSAAIFALVSLEENSPMGIEEAMAAGIPVVTSNRCGMPYMVRDGESGRLVDPTDAGAVAAALGEILKDASVRAGMSVASRRIAQDRFHPERVVARTLHVYRSALAAGRRA